MFFWNDKMDLRTFYVFQTRLTIPAGIDFMFRRKRYTTFYVISLLQKAYEKNIFPPDTFKPEYWIKDTNNKFMQFTKNLLKKI